MEFETGDGKMEKKKIEKLKKNIQMENGDGGSGKLR